MDPREQAMKAWLDGKFVKFTGKYGEGTWPFEVRKVDRDFIPFREVKEPGPAKWLADIKNRKWTVITDEQVAIIRQRYRQGFSLAKIAAEIKRHATTIRPIYDQAAAEIGPVEKNYTRGRKFEWTDEQRKRLLELRKRRLSWRQIGHELGCTHDVASREHYALTGDRTMLPSNANSNPLHWTEEETRRLLELRALGLSQPEIGSRLGRSRWSIGARLTRLAGKDLGENPVKLLHSECDNAGRMVT